MFSTITFYVALLLASSSRCALEHVPLQRQDAAKAAVVDLSRRRGTPQHFASGILYGISNAPDQIPDSFYTDMGLNFCRTGGAQLAAGGWINGLPAYQTRFESAKRNYHTCRRFGASVFMLPHDLWGTDYASSSTHWPGDNGDWTDYDKSLNQLIGDLKKNNMLDGLVFDIWNEPDGGLFWKRSASQYLDLYVRTYHRIRQDTSLAAMKISGPSSAFPPSSGDSWLKTWLSTAMQKNAIPDIYAWHAEPGDLRKDLPAFNALLKQTNAPTRDVNINEYGALAEQHAAGDAWYISRFERYNVHGLRGNWLGGCQLHDFLASLLGKSSPNDCNGQGYYGNGGYQVYKYYAKSMLGVRASTETSGDGKLDVYTTIDTTMVRTLAGVLTSTGKWHITIKGLSSVGLPPSGSLRIRTLAFEDKGHFGRVHGPSDRGTVNHAYSRDSVTFDVDQSEADKTTAFAFELSIGHPRQ